ncbi:hypothetical protein P170DRAFT_434927 [Aspergillus steynii IBT 23096]|uniref:AT DNA binding protein n=1 Tax=Aspergillus steynii IBT 23096 TaxID=1392250 RepID=A0A2I2GK18_9EURO|nr:uncharacterized protein P170DRAFT_434927 [Aspergillus steynii IBT 23096]PLB53223.1 hypothetical protein P170DRAFT_434927 [Aspergillus steynii IBT 23096]
MANGSGHWGSTPSKMPSPSHERKIISPDNTLYAGHTPMPPRTYPTPTASSLDEEKRESAPSDNPTTNGDLRQDESHPTDGPTDEQREFDSIIESEGFSMVSLDTLPSAKQHGLEGNGDSKIGKSALRRVWNQDTIGSLQRKTSKQESDAGSNPRSRQSSKELRTRQSSKEPRTRHSRQSSHKPGSSSGKPKPAKSLSPPATSAPKSTIQKGPLSRLARMIRLGVALEGTMRHAYESPGIMATPHIPNSGDQVSDMNASRKRMEILFSSFNPEMHHELRGALRFGHELARRKRQAEKETARPRKATKSPTMDTPRAKGRDSAQPSATPLQQINSNRRPQSPSTMMKRRMEEWQKEREAISREIQMANTSQVIVIDSDDGGSRGPDSEYDAREPSVEQEQDQEPEFDRAAPFEALADPADDFSDDGVDAVDQNHYDDQLNGHYQDQSPGRYQDEYQFQDQDHDQYHQDPNQEEDLHEHHEPESEHPHQSPSQGLDIMDDQYYRDLDLGVDNDDYDHYRELDLGPDSNDESDRGFDLARGTNEDQYRDPGQDQDVNDVQYPDLAQDQDGHEDQHQDQDQYGGSEEDDDDEDIWQQEAHNQSAHSHRSPATYGKQNDMAAGQGSSPWKNDLTTTPGEQGESSPDYWITKREKVPFLGQSRVRQLREQDVDLSNLYRAENTPRRSRYYQGTSSPMSAAKRRPAQSSPSTKASQHDDDVHGYVPENELQSDGFLASSPRLSDDEAFQVDPTTRHENAWQLALAQRDERGNEGIPDAAVTDQPSAHETHGITPERPPASAELPASSLFRRIASLTPGWLKAPIRRSPKRPSPPVREESSEDEEPEQAEEAEAAAVAPEDKEEDEEEEDEELPVEPASFAGEVDDEPDGEIQDNQEMEETPRPPYQVARASHERHSSATPRPGQMLDHEHASPDVGTKGDTYERPFPLAVSGYFSDDHYAFLRRLYRLAKSYPERFPYHSSAQRTGIIGDWIWTSDGVHGVPITERQFAIIDRFVQELAKADLQAGGTGQVGWTEADVHRRLISIIIGEEIRKERKAGMHKGPWGAESSRSRATATRSWR